jgi:hypothetical protein
MAEVEQLGSIDTAKPVTEPPPGTPEIEDLVWESFQRFMVKLTHLAPHDVANAAATLALAVATATPQAAQYVSSRQTKHKDS